MAGISRIPEKGVKLDLFPRGITIKWDKSSSATILGLYICNMEAKVSGRMSLTIARVTCILPTVWIRVGIALKVIIAAVEGRVLLKRLLCSAASIEKRSLTSVARLQTELKVEE